MRGRGWGQEGEYSWWEYMKWQQFPGLEEWGGGRVVVWPLQNKTEETIQQRLCYSDFRLGYANQSKHRMCD